MACQSVDALRRSISPCSCSKSRMRFLIICSSSRFLSGLLILRCSRACPIAPGRRAMCTGSGCLSFCRPSVTKYWRNSGVIWLQNAEMTHIRCITVSANERSIQNFALHARTFPLERRFFCNALSCRNRVRYNRHIMRACLSNTQTTTSAHERRNHYESQTFHQNPASRLSGRVYGKHSCLSLIHI